MLGMSKSSYYRAINWIVERAMSAQRHDDKLQKAADDQAEIELRKRLLALVLLHPTWGYQRFARQLRQDLTQISANMVANLLRELCLDLRRARIEKLIEEVVNGRLSELSEEQAESIAEVNSLVNDKLLFPAEDELVFGTTLVPAFDLLGPHCYLQLFVELRSLFTFGRFIKKTQDAIANLRIQYDNESDLDLLQDMTKKRCCRVYWTSRSWGCDLSGYRPLSAMRESPRYCTRVRQAPAGSAMMKERMGKWLSSYSPATLKDKGLIESLGKWCSNHNLSPTENRFPTGGRVPADILGLDRDQVHAFMARSLTDENREPMPSEKWISRQKKREKPRD